MEARRPPNLVRLPEQRDPHAGRTVQEIALDELEDVYGFLFRRVGNRPDAEDLTQQVALRAVPRLRPDASVTSVRAYLFQTARTVLAGHWAARFALPQTALEGDVFAVAADSEDSTGAPASELAAEILSRLPERYAKVLELRFLRNCSAKEVARQMETTAGNVRIMQLRALRAAAEVQIDG